MAFANKYMKLLPALAQGFSAATTIDTTGDYPLELKSENWELYVLVRDLKKASGRTGYAVRIGLKPASRTALDYQLFQLVTQEQKEIDKDVRERAVERARANGELKGLR
ncbi:hypothetical protein CSQ96_18810 [Janthinobacterium sp. BJB412]|nr:hypothetical protein CSQ96_18810 [Janthinobacterium sp. BJB412]